MSNLKHECFPLYPYTVHSIKALEEWLELAKDHSRIATKALDDHDQKRAALELEMSKRTEIVNDIQHAIQILRSVLVSRMVEGL